MAKTTGQMAGIAAGAFLGAGAGGIQGALMGASWGYAAGTMLDPPNSDTGDMPPMGSYPVQKSSSGIPIQKVYGSRLVAGDLLWLGPNHPWQQKEEQGGKGGSSASVVTGSGNRRSFLIGVAEGQASVGRIFKNKEEITFDGITVFEGDGSSDTGIEALIGEDFANYANTCCVFFNEQEVGTGGSLPNYTFEVNSTLVSYENIIMSANAHVYVFDQNYEILRSHIISSYSVDLATDGRYVSVGDSAFGANPVAMWDSDGNDLGIVFDDTAAPEAIGVWEGVRFSMDGEFLYGLYRSNNFSKHTLIKWNARTGAKIWEVTPPGGLLASRHLDIDADDNLYFSKLWPTVNPDLYDFAGRYDKDGNHIGGWDRTPMTYYNMIVPSLGTAGYHYCTGSYVAFGEYDIAWAIDIATGTVYSQDFGSVDFTNIGLSVASNGEFTYVHISKAVGGNNLFKCSPDLQTIYGSTNTDGGIVSMMVNANDQLVLFMFSGEDVTGNDVVVYDLDLVRLAGYDSIIGGLGGFNVMDTIQVPKGQSSSTTGDANPVLVIKDLLTNTRYGLGLDLSELDLPSFSTAAAYCSANDLLYSFVIDRRRPIVDWINYINNHFQGFFRMSEGKLEMLIFKEESPAFEITRDDLLVEEGEDPEPPVRVEKRLSSDTANRVEVNWTDREAIYAIATVVATDESDQRATGRTKKRVVQLTGITNITLAQKMVNRILMETMYRFSTFNFTVGYKSMLLEAGDVGTISDGFMLEDEIIRIINIEETKDGKELAITAVEDSPYLYKVYEYAAQEGERVPDSAPTLEDADATLTESMTEQGLAISIAPTGEDTNGWQIYKSYDDVSYEFVGNSYIDDPSASPTNATGVLSSPLSAHKTGPVYSGQGSIVVDIGVLTVLDTAITNDQFFNNKRLCKIGDEIIAYKTCEQTAVEGVWRITGLMRGMFGTEAVAHIVGETFWTINTDFTFVYADSDIGKTIYFKFLTLYGSSIQSLTDVTGIPYLVEGKFKRPMPLSLLRIRGREGLDTYEEDDPIIDFYFCSKTAGFNLGGHGNILWGSYIEDPSIIQFGVTIEEEDGTEISSTVYDLSEFGDPKYYELLEAERESNNPVRVKLQALSSMSSIGERSILMEKI